MGIVKQLKTAALLFTLAAAIYAIRTEQSHGRLLGVPFEFRLPTPQRLRRRWWNRQDHRLLTPHVFGVGWSLNLYQLLKRLGYVGQDREGEGCIPDV